MNAKDAADIIDEIIQSLKANPKQFHISINVTGQSVTSYGGIGMNVTTFGGGPGSTTIGNNVTMSGASIQIAQERGSQAMNEQFRALINALSQISDELKKPTPDKSLALRILNSMKETWVPGVILGVVGNVVSKAFGI